MPVVEKVEDDTGEYYNPIVLQPMDDMYQPPTVTETARGPAPGQETEVPYKAEPKLSDEQEAEDPKQTHAEVPPALHTKRVPKTVVFPDIPDQIKDNEFPDLPQLPQVITPAREVPERVSRRSPRESLQLRSRLVKFN